MKTFITILLLSFAISCFSQAETDSLIYSRTKELSEKFKNNTITSEEWKEAKNLIFQIQNKGFLLEEKHYDYKGALYHIDKALEYWKEFKDTLSEANLLKYRGLLLGYLGKYEEAKEDCRHSCYLFNLKKNEDGIAVVHFDLAQVFRMEQRVDSALHYAKRAYHHWDVKGEQKRIGHINKLLLCLYIDAKEYSKAEKLQKELGLHLKDNSFWMDELDVYYLSWRLYTEMQQSERAGDYNKRYRETIEKFSDKTARPRSTYEN